VAEPGDRLGERVGRGGGQAELGPPDASNASSAGQATPVKVAWVHRHPQNSLHPRRPAPARRGAPAGDCSRSGGRGQQVEQGGSRPSRYERACPATLHGPVSPRPTSRLDQGDVQSIRCRELPRRSRESKRSGVRVPDPPPPGSSGWADHRRPARSTRRGAIAASGVIARSRRHTDRYRRASQLRRRATQVRAARPGRAPVVVANPTMPVGRGIGTSPPPV